jgi:hypothetical protein
MNTFMNWVIGGIALLILLSIIFRPYDSTDAPGVRSGLQLYTDAATGCQYLRAGMFSPLVPRMARLGSYGYVHVCDPYTEHVEGK